MGIPPCLEFPYQSMPGGENCAAEKFFGKIFLTRHRIQEGKEKDAYVFDLRYIGTEAGSQNSGSDAANHDSPGSG
jgi:hypothetical protein